MHSIDRQRCIDPNVSRELEWLATNGRGGFAMGTVAGILTRRYHGLLVAAPQSPAQRYVLLAKLDVTVEVGEKRFELSANDYPGAVHPQGYRWLESFCDAPEPTWRWHLEGARIEQRIRIRRGHDRTCVELRCLPDDSGASGAGSGAAVEIEVRPLCAGRHYHSLYAHDARPAPQVESNADGWRLRWAEGATPELHLSAMRESAGDDYRASVVTARESSLAHHDTARGDSVTAIECTSAPDWYYQVMLSEETRRGYDDRQDLFCPGTIRATLWPGGPGLMIVASCESAPEAVLETPLGSPLERGETRESAAVVSAPASSAGSLPYTSDRLLEPLARAAEQFVVSRPDGRSTVIAGYPWFADWGRDTFISLPGLLLVTGRHAPARDVLMAFAKWVDRGMTPNRFPDQAEAGGAVEQPEYNSVDASLWYVVAMDRTQRYAPDEASKRALYPLLCEILTHYTRGTRYGIRQAEDGLLACGEPGVQLTWMDAKVGDWVVTPRIGKPVEINALWHEALQTGAAWAAALGHRADATTWRDQAERCAEAFNRRFWNEAGGCLHDVIDCDHRDGTVDDAMRPNQLFAISLPHPVLSRERWRSVVDRVREELLTPMGLRTLSPKHPNYRPFYRGDQAARDAAYHQGTVWPWLLGPMVTAFVRAHGEAADARLVARSFLYGLETHLEESGVGGVSEVADGDDPHRPGGCPWQAWSVAEPLRALAESILQLGSPS